MALIERVATLLRANLRDMLERAEDPEKTLTQLSLDVENQLLQVKTQVAIALADKHLLEKRLGEQQMDLDTWHRRAELAVEKGDDVLARAALDRTLHHEQLLRALTAEVEDQTAEAETLRTAYVKLQAKLAETRSECEVLRARHRRARLMGQAASLQSSANESEAAAFRRDALRRINDQTSDREARGRAMRSMPTAESLQDRLAALERSDRVEELLAELKRRQGPLPTA